MSQEPLRLLLLAGEPGWGPGLEGVLGSKGLALCHCSRSEEAESLLQQPGPVDLIVVDLNIGSQPCRQFGQWLRHQHQRPPVLAVGSCLSEPRRVRLLESWADDVQPMPLAVPEFVARCRALWRRHQLRLMQLSQRSPQTLLRCADLEMWVEEHRVCRDGRAVQLTPREFRLLEFLMRHPGQVLDRTTLLEQVWGEFASLELDPKTIDVHIRWLRLKLEHDPSLPQLLVTVRGHGYRLC